MNNIDQILIKIDPNVIWMKDVTMVTFLGLLLLLEPQIIRAQSILIQTTTNNNGSYKKIVSLECCVLIVCQDIS